MLWQDTDPAVALAWKFRCQAAEAGASHTLETAGVSHSQQDERGAALRSACVPQRGFLHE